MRPIQEWSVARWRIVDGLVWTSCPDPETLGRAAEAGATLVVNLAPQQCRYPVPPGMDYIELDIPDFSFTAHEHVYAEALAEARRRAARGEKTLIHCLGGIGRSGTAVAMYLVSRGLTLDKALARVQGLGGGPQVPAQELALRWFARAHGLLGDRLLDVYRDAAEAGLRDQLRLEHASTVAGVALDILEALAPLARLEKLDYVDAYLAGFLHDIGRETGAGHSHHVRGAEAVRRMESVARLGRPAVVAKAVLHHRRGTDLLEDAELRALGWNAVLVAAAVRAADAVENAYVDEGLYYGVELRGDRLVFRGSLWLEVAFRDIVEKSRALSELTGLKVGFEKVHYF